jgi:hypothetical protein
VEGGRFIPGEGYQACVLAAPEGTYRQENEGVLVPRYYDFKKNQEVGKHLRVVDFGGRTGSGHYQWICECELCGTKKHYLGRKLRAGDHDDCGCRTPAKKRAKGDRDVVVVWGKGPHGHKKGDPMI